MSEQLIDKLAEQVESLRDTKGRAQWRAAIRGVEMALDALRPLTGGPADEETAEPGLDLHEIETITGN